MELLLLCAGAGEKSWTGSKTERPLRTKGKRRAQKVGAFLGQSDLRPERVWSTADKRARVTAEKSLKAAGWTAQDIQLSRRLAEGRLPQVGELQRALLVAPRGTIRTLCDRLGLAPALKSGVLIVMSHTCDETSLTKVVDPRDLPDLFPYPAPDGPELRQRPAYYYTQSAVVPFRKTKQGPEILIVGSSSGRHWVVPKGIVDPGRSPAESAMKEAEEEAGVAGTTFNEPLGSFCYRKWGATCRVTVFAMEVTNILPEEAWEERHRTRQWVSAAEAAELIHEPAYRNMILRI